MCENMSRASRELEATANNKNFRKKKKKTILPCFESLSNLLTL